ncbi:MAG: hypothetical protein NT133_17585, partial [Alphaproteobacteria bacterium]|nr:hypothetical protein [Alphaproteobacteria bacterium]
MTRAPKTAPDAVLGIHAVIGGMLCALLAALPDVARVRPRAAAYTGVMEVALRAAAEIDIEVEPYVEWIAVPAPWRATQGAARRRGRAMESRGSGVRAGFGMGPPGRGPPVWRPSFAKVLTG